MLNLRVLAASAAILVACPVSAATIITQTGSTASFAAPSNGTVINFDDALPTGFTLVNTNASIVQGTTAAYAEPAASDGSRYLAVLANGTSTLQSGTAFDSVSFYLGSIDTYNTVDLLSTTGEVIQSFTGAAFGGTANGDQEWPLTNRRVTLIRSAGDAAIGGIRFASSANSAEIDTIVFAVPEVTTWVMMLIGFGMIGATARYRRRSVATTYA